MKSRKYWYWIIQFLSWSLFGGAMAVVYQLNGNPLELEAYHILLDFSIIVLLSIAFSHVLKLSINRTIRFDHIKKRDFLWLVCLILITSVLFNLFYSALYIPFVYNYVYDRPDVLLHESQSLKNHIVLLINYTIYFSVWVLFYVGIKSLTQLNESREEKLELESNLKTSQLNVLKGQINPHFMFNSLNNIKGLILEDPMKSREMITRLSDMLRYSLVSGDVDEVTLKEELSVVDHYIALSKIQLEDRLTFIKEIDEALYEIKVPPLVIQMLIENAIKHGISDLQQGGEVLLQISRNNAYLSIMVENDGRLSKKNAGTSIGLLNIKERLGLLYGEGVEFTLTEKDSHVIASIKIPYQNV